MNTGIVLCSRLGSRRIPKKAIRKINGIPVIEHLIMRLIKTHLKVFLAVPLNEMKDYREIIKNFDPKKVILIGGNGDDPLRRMADVADTCSLDIIIRVCHDKIFIDPDLLHGSLDYFRRNSLDYLYSSRFTEGTGFEIISSHALKIASEKFKKVEHISYAIRAVTKNYHNWKVPKDYQSDIRLLIDYPEDITLMETVFSSLGNTSCLKEVLHFCDKNQWTKKINRLPELTIYTCAYNAEKWINKCMGSVVKQEDFSKFEYVIIDDFSSDNTSLYASKLSSQYSNVQFIRNTENIGLAGSSNVALDEAKGNYIMRIDADDFFPSKTACREMIDAIEAHKLDVLYPNNYYGSPTVVQHGRDQHHVGGAIFNKRAINHIRFTKELRGHDSLDVFLRARHQLKIGYLNKPMFFYRQHKDSLSKNNKVDRDAIKRRLHEQHP